jgi:DNA mismatch repair protein MutS
VTTKQRIKNFNIAVREWNEKIIFLRRLIPGGTSRSYGIQVAQIAGVPEAVIKRAKEILSNLEKTEADEAGRPRLARHRVSEPAKGGMVQLALFGSEDREIREWIRGLDIEGMTPVEALITLNDLKQRVGSGLIDRSDEPIRHNEGASSD